MLTPPDFHHIVALALAEDFGVPAERFAPHETPSPDVLDHDVTSCSAIGLDSRFSGLVVAREECVVAGLPVAAAVWDQLSVSAGLFDPIEVFPLVAEGALVRAGTPVLEVEGLAVAVLAGERTALDFLMVLSGIATETARWVAEAGPDLAICDTRKTVPGLRELSKYAVEVGGGVNHRHGLYDMVLIKDNHVRAAGGIMAAVEAARQANPTLLVEVEADTVDQALEAVEAGADMVLLDNMSDELLSRAVKSVREAAEDLEHGVLTEASGGIRFERLAALRASGVDRVSTSALTMGVRAIDFGFDEA